MSPTLSENDPVKDDPEVVVLGAGPAGLSAAWELVREGVPTLLVEKEDGPGGLCRSIHRDGFTFDQGGHRFITKDRELFERVVGLLGDRLHVAERRSVIQIDGREYSYPLRLGEVVRGEGILGVAGILGSYLVARARRGEPPASFEDWVKQNFGARLHKKFFSEYTEKLWGIPSSELSADWAGQRIPRLSLASVARRALGLERKSPRTFARRYCYPRQGIGEIFERIAQEVAERGGGMLTRSRATAARVDARVHLTLETPSGVRDVSCRHVISTIPIADLVSILPEEDRPAVDGNSLRYRSLRFLNVLLDSPPVAQRTWIYVPAKKYVMTRIQIPSMRSRANCPQGKSSVQLEIPCTEGDELWRCDSASLLRRGLDDLRAMGLDVSRFVQGSFDTRAPHAYPVYDSGYRERRGAVLDRVESLGWLETCGRQGRFQYIFFDKAMREGIDAARRCLGKPVSSPVDDEDPLLPEESRSLIEGLPSERFGAA